MDLGYVTNAGYTFRRGLSRPEDDRFMVELAVMLADPPPYVPPPPPLPPLPPTP